MSTADEGSLPPYEAAAALNDLSRAELLTMRAAGQAVLDCRRELAATGDSVVGILLGTVNDLYEWDHVPAGDVADRDTGAQYFYHAHPADERPDEHGHFHTFVDARGVPPAPQPPLDTGDPHDTLTHLIAVAMDRTSEPTKLFTTNRWVTGGVWCGADDAAALLERFDIGGSEPSRLVNIWLSQLLVLFRPQIRLLLAERDRVLERWQQDHPDADVLEDRELHAPSELAISIKAQIAAVDEALNAFSAR